MNNLTTIEQQIIDHLKLVISFNQGLTIDQVKSYFKEDPEYRDLNKWDKPSQTMQRLKKKGLVICINRIWIYKK